MSTQVNFCEVCGREDKEERQLALRPITNWAGVTRLCCINCAMLINSIVYREKRLYPKRELKFVLTKEDKEFLQNIDAAFKPKELPVGMNIYRDVGCSQEDHLPNCSHFGESGLYLSEHAKDCPGGRTEPCICNPKARKARKTQEK